MSADRGAQQAYPHVGRILETYRDGAVATEVLTQGGLTKRELFAAMAMQGLMANRVGYANSDIAAAGSLEAAVASDAITMADALLRKLEEAK